MSAFLQHIPQYFLYGEAVRDVDQHFLHVESIAARSALHDWRIEPHLHRKLHHLLWVVTGSGVFRIEDRELPFSAPALIGVPMHAVHGFEFVENTDGWVVTASNELLQRVVLAHAELQSVLHEPLLQSPVERSTRFDAQFAALAEEFRGTQRARRAAIESLLLAILVDTVRLQAEHPMMSLRPPDADAELVDRYRTLIEEHFRLRWGAADYAARLCVSHERLRLACVRVTGRSPLALLNARRLLEAKRCLLYTNMNIATLARACGFEDPAYFSRFFARGVGCSPRAYRAARHGG